MLLKRPLYADAQSGTQEPSVNDCKRFKNSIRDVVGLLSLQDLVGKMEPFIRTAIRDEMEQVVLRVLNPSFRSSLNQKEISGRRSFLLCFANKPPSTIFTGSRIEAEDRNAIRIELLDSDTRALVTSGPLSCMKIEVVVLDGDFSSDDGEDWNENQFNARVIRERAGRRPLVTGEDLNVRLTGGVALISDVAFTDNSSWQRSRKFRLGARPAPKTDFETRIREAVSEAFVVKDHRGELYKKHYPPQLQDEVWRLEKIAKEGISHKKLAKFGINTVRDLLQLYAVNPSELRRILGRGISNRTWKAIIEHANTCFLDDKLYTYFDAGQNNYGLLLNSVYKVIGVTFDGQIYEPLDKLTPLNKDLVENLKRKAYKNVNEFILIDSGSISVPARILTYPETDSFYRQALCVQPVQFPEAQQDQLEATSDFNANLQFSLAQSTNQTNLFPSTLRNSFKLEDFFLPLNEETTWPPSVSPWPVATTRNQSTPDDVSLQAQTSTSSADNSSGWE